MDRVQLLYDVHRVTERVDGVITKTEFITEAWVDNDHWPSPDPDVIYALLNTPRFMEVKMRVVRVYKIKENDGNQD
jgi:hypothetical protein